MKGSILELEMYGPQSQIQGQVTTDQPAKPLKRNCIFSFNKQ